MSELQVTARLTVHDGRLAEFKEVAAACMRSVREKDTGTLQYDWFFSPDGAVCEVRETYRDSAAVFEHIGNLGDTLGDLMSVADMHLSLYGQPSPELAAALDDMGASVYTPFQSM